MLDEEAFVQSIPKIELHLHLDGSLSSGNYYLFYYILCDAWLAGIYKSALDT